MRLDGACSIFATALAAAWSAGPAGAEPAALRIARADPGTFEPTFRFAVAAEREPRLSFVVRERLELVLSGGKDKSLGDSQGRRAEGAAGRSPAPKAARVGIRFKW